jgi:hypothetical protein
MQAGTGSLEDTIEQPVASPGKSMRSRAGLWLALAAVVIAAIGLAGWASGQSFPDIWNDDASAATAPIDLALLTNPPVHEHADFAVFLNGERLNFDDERYFSDEETSLAPDVHIHPGRPNVVHKHRQNVNWGTFFASLGMTLEDDHFVDADGNTYANGAGGTLKFYINGVQIDSLKHERISDLDRILITYGTEDAEALAAQIAAVGDEACIPSEKCDARIDPNEPDEPCSVTGPGASVCY